MHAILKDKNLGHIFKNGIKNFVKKYGNPAIYQHFAYNIGKKMHLALGTRRGTSSSSSTGRPENPLKRSKVTCAICLTLVGHPMSMILLSLEKQRKKYIYSC